MVAVGPAHGFLLPAPGSALQHVSTNAPFQVGRAATITTTTLRAAPIASLPTAEIVNFEFQGHQTYSEIYRSIQKSNNKNNNLHVLLIHGFGCSTVYWRETISALTREGYTVHALDLLGQGKSAKPVTPNLYSINLWAQQVEAYAQANVPIKGGNNGGIVLMGNSLGSVVALSAATSDYLFEEKTDSTPNYDKSFIRQHCKGIGMYNCGIGMNSRNLMYDFEGFQRVFFTAVFDLLDALVFGNIPLLTYVLDKVVTKELLRNALTGLYQYADAPESRVNEALVDSFYTPAKDPNSPRVLSQIYTNDPGSAPMEIYQRHLDLFAQKIPIHLVWGEQDGVTPLTGSVGQFFLSKSQSDDNNGVSMNVITGGHIPFDEVPQCNDFMVQWLNTVVTAKSNAASQPSFSFKLPFFQ